MKKYILSIISCIMTATVALGAVGVIALGAQTSVGATDTTEVVSATAETDTYYYDRLNEKQKSYYVFLKNFFDTWDAEPGDHPYDWSCLLDGC